uniref:Amino acid permease/ SLC12A domain-containing protein n=1 Tax=Entomoneis paludosa TaxID=265537 RepID=A0A7S2Y342_9STRA|mmetsp:Transcript_12601/g.26095  ORF Transcript_12601/g.26095 Transcript_12601/m.26095 type:complete len:524 (+) Transcript_12601:121-1692(+)
MDNEEEATIQEHEAEAAISSEAMPRNDGDTVPEAGSSFEDPFEIQERLGVVSLTIITFYGVSGGPFGVEETVRSAGSFYTLLGFIVMPLIWSLQEALMTAELSAAFPEPSGGVAWVQKAFGDRMGWMTGYLSWVSGATDNAIYPVLFVDYVMQLSGGSTDDIGQFTKFLVFSSISCVLAYTNWLGLPVVGKMSMTICLVAMSPFIILCIVGAFQVDPSRWFTPPDNANSDQNGEDSGHATLFSFATWGAISWRPYLNNLFWNLNSFDSTSCFAAEVEDPGRTLPRALGWSVVMVALGYILPLLVALGASNAKQSDWVDGYFSVIAEEIAGRWLAGWLVFAAGISNIALFQAELSSDAFQLMGMAEKGYLPKIFAVRSRHGTPTYSLAVGTIIIICMSVTNLDQLIEMLNFNYSISLLFEYVAFLKLRISHPHIHRPYKIPLSTAGCFVLFTPTIVATLVVMMLASLQTIMFSAVVNGLGFLLFSVRENEVCHKYARVNDEQTEEEDIDLGELVATSASTGELG